MKTVKSVCYSECLYSCQKLTEEFKGILWPDFAIDVQSILQQWQRSEDGSLKGLQFHGKLLVLFTDEALSFQKKLLVNKVKRTWLLSH